MLCKENLRHEAAVSRVGRGSVDLSPVLADWLSGFERIASYVAFGDEPAVAPQVGWLLPVLRADDDLEWARYDGQLAPGRWGVQEPVGPWLGIDAIAFAQVVLVPALRVDRQGYRLGRGRGCFDRALRRVTGITVALLHDGELVDEVPREPHDIPVNGVATPSDGLVLLP